MRKLKYLTMLLIFGLFLCGHAFVFGKEDTMGRDDLGNGGEYAKGGEERALEIDEAGDGSYNTGEGSELDESGSGSQGSDED
jgi:hypothetical protein